MIYSCKTIPLIARSMMTKTSRTNRLARVFMGASAMDKKAMLWYLHSISHCWTGIDEMRGSNRKKKHGESAVNFWHQWRSRLTYHHRRLPWQPQRLWNTSQGRNKPEGKNGLMKRTRKLKEKPVAASNKNEQRDENLHKGTTRPLQQWTQQFQCSQVPTAWKCKNKSQVQTLTH